MKILVDFKLGDSKHEIEKKQFSIHQISDGPRRRRKIAFLFGPDTLLSAQYFENFRRKTLLEPEKRLMLAVLDDAVNCFQENFLAQSGRGKKLFDEAEKWILAEGSDYICAFENICEVLGFNPEYLRGGLVRWKEKKLSQQPNAKAWEERKMVG